jgi:hypothetical protein
MSDGVALALAIALASVALALDRFAMVRMAQFALHLAGARHVEQ